MRKGNSTKVGEERAGAEGRSVGVNGGTSGGYPLGGCIGAEVGAKRRN